MTQTVAFGKYFSDEIALLDKGEFDAIPDRLIGKGASEISRTAFDIAIHSRRRLGDLGFDIKPTEEIVKIPSMDDVPVNLADMKVLFGAIRKKIEEYEGSVQPCPSCGGVGKPVSQAKFMTLNPQARLYFDMEELFAHLENHTRIDPEFHEFIISMILYNTNQMVKVCKCLCGLFYVNWPYIEKRAQDSYQIAGEYAYTYSGKPLVGRAQDPAFVYGKLLLPFFLENLLGPLQGRTVFDLGSAEGIMVEGFRRLGAMASGSEVDSGKIAYAQEIFGHENADLSSCDLLVCFHVLEHLVTVKPWLERMKASVVPGGFLVISVPRSFQRTDGLVSDMGGDHLIGFDEKTLIQHIAEVGLKVEYLCTDGAQEIEKAEHLDAPIWSGRRNDITIVARR